MPSILKIGKPHGYGAGTLGSFIDFLVVLDRWCACREYGLPPLTLARQFLSTSTGIECQQPAGHAGRRRQQHIRIWDVGIMFPCAVEKGWIRSQSKVEPCFRLWRAALGGMSSACGRTPLKYYWSVTLPHGYHAQNSRVISYSSRLVL